MSSRLIYSYYPLVDKNTKAKAWCSWCDLLNYKMELDRLRKLLKLWCVRAGSVLKSYTYYNNITSLDYYILKKVL